MAAAPEPEAKLEDVTPSLSREPLPESESDAPASTGREPLPESESDAPASSQELKPWEQHAAVINLPRYDYRASGSLLLRSHSGFLITCPIKREKSATKEAISILEEYCHANCCVSEHTEPCDVENAVKKRKLCLEASGSLEEAVTNGNSNSVSESIGGTGNSSSPQSKMNDNVGRASNLSLVKLSRSGLLFFKFPSGGLHVVEMLTEILHSLKSGKLKSPQWCHRIFPIQETCILSEEDLHATVSKLFLDFSRSKTNKDKTIKFAVAYNRRGIDETEKNSNEGSNQQALMGREQCFKVVAAAVKSVAENSVVDLRSPEVGVLVEMLPVSGVPLGSSVAGVSVLPAELISTKPRLCVRSLVLDAKSNKKEVKSCGPSRQPE
ncbi:hypothetical protein BDA96_04G304000 [Sorghum bicolor]|uniref:THUMP domain-containing protein n=2 Tax=Sorghum bicolor TaxID=4558 RepID=A0A921R7B5_SORBI|nr:hypothetical protein BDA96_04G304000 [Sorghum bicolor]KXG31024.1 hypothetical protein SORBI_3004G285200 [Sorghum bicolor]